MSEPGVDLESFRRKWRADIDAQRQQRGDGRPEPSPSKNVKAAPPAVKKRMSHTEHEDDGISSSPYHDLEDRGEGGRKLSDEHGPSKPTPEPRSALEHFEHAVERESQGNLGDSLTHYRKAYRLDAKVDQSYRNKYFPGPLKKSAPPTSTNSERTAPATKTESKDSSLTSLHDLIASFADLTIPRAEPDTSLSAPPPCPIAELPSEILDSILLFLAVEDVASFARLAGVCKRFAYLVGTSESMWRRVASGPEFGLGGMHYTYGTELLGQEIQFNEPTAPRLLQLSSTEPHSTFRDVFRHEPRVRFGGCYISTVNYVRPGAAATAQTVSWSAPVHIVTYYRYLRFYRDGTALSLLTTSEPVDVVHHLSKEALRAHADGAAAGLPSAVIRNALRGRWKLIPSAAVPLPPIEAEPPLNLDADQEHNDGDDGEDVLPGDVLLETEGVGEANKYMYKLHLSLRSSGTSSQRARNTKFVWKRFWSYNRLTDDWAEFGLRNDRPFFWSRVKSYEP